MARSGVPTICGVMLLAQASTSGNDTIIGFNTADVLQGGAGNDTLNGGQGDDTYIYARGDGNDVITEAVAISTSSSCTALRPAMSAWSAMAIT